MFTDISNVLAAFIVRAITGSYGHGMEPSDSIKGGEFLV
jgi:hypothetical protein